MADYNQWYLVETLADEPPTVVSAGGTVKNWTSLARLAPAPGVHLEPLVQHVRSTRRRHQLPDVRAARGPGFRIEAIPVLGPSGEVHAVQIWIGDSTVEPDPPRIVSGISWLLEKAVIAQTLEASMMSGVRPEDHVNERTAPEYYSKAVKFDDSERLFSLAFDPRAGDRWDSHMSVLHADGRVMRWHCWGRARTDPGNLGLRLLWHDVSDTTPPQVPTLAELGMQETIRASSVYAGVFVADNAVLTMWLPSPPPWVEWRNVRGGNEIVHPEDRHYLSEALLRFRTGMTDAITVTARLRSAGDTWTPSTLCIRPYPGQLADRLVIVQVSRDDA